MLASRGSENRETSKKKIKVHAIHLKISINLRNYEFPGVNFPGLSPVVLIRFSHMESEGGRGKKNLPGTKKNILCKGFGLHVLHAG